MYRLCIFAAFLSCAYAFPKVSKRSGSYGQDCFQYPSYFFWYKWEMYELLENWQPGIIDSWDGIDQDSPTCKLLQTMVVYDSAGKPHVPRGVDPKMKAAVEAEQHDVHLSVSNEIKKREYRVKRNFRLNARLWEQNTIPYEINPSMGTEMRGHIENAIKYFTDLTCVRLKQRNQVTESLGHNSYIYFTDDGDTCSSYVGRVFNGRQDINLSQRYCQSVRTVIHEIMHAIGQMHEQQRTDRDRYITMNWDNILSGQSNNNMNQDNTHDRTPYDVESIMQYDLKAFAIDRNRNAMDLKDARLEALVGASDTLTHTDVKEINLAYQCAASCPSKPDCQTGGFVAPYPDCTCMCPDSTTGVLCEQPITDPVCGGVINLSAGQKATITSPNYDKDDPYNTDTVCVWIVRGPSDSNIKLTIEELDLPRDSFRSYCYHWLAIRYHLPGQTGIKQCNLPSPNQVFQTTNDGEKNIMILKFDSRFSKERQPSQNHRFLLKVEPVGGSSTANPCNPNPCNNGGVCSVSGLSFNCACSNGWTGTICNVQMQSCEPNPCQNGGLCEIISNSISCKCQKGWTGPNCEVSDGPNSTTSTTSSTVTTRVSTISSTESTVSTTVIATPTSISTMPTSDSTTSTAVSVTPTSSTTSTTPTLTTRVCNYEEQTCWLNNYNNLLTIQMATTGFPPAIEGSRYGYIGSDSYFYLYSSRTAIQEKNYCVKFNFYMHGYGGVIELYQTWYQSHHVYFSTLNYGLSTEVWYEVKQNVQGTTNGRLDIYGYSYVGGGLGIDNIQLTEGGCQA